jgi:hypothetical protein
MRRFHMPDYDTPETETEDWRQLADCLPQALRDRILGKEVEE